MGPINKSWHVSFVLHSTPCMLKMLSVLLACIVLLSGAYATSSLPPPRQRLRTPKSSYNSRLSLSSSNIARAVVPTQFTIPKFKNPKAATFHVNSSALPLVTFPLQDSWAGRLPISAGSSRDKQLFYWYWPSSAHGGSDTLSIWLNGVSRLFSAIVPRSRMG